MSDKAYRDWISRQPSCISGEFSEYVNGEGRNPACHVRRASTSGTAYKAKYSCVPMTTEEHNFQHAHGETACLVRYAKLNLTTPEAKQWFDNQVVKYREMWENA